MAHLDDDEKLAWMEDISAEIKAALAGAATKCEREQKCVGCVAQVIALTLIDHAAWFISIVAESSDDARGVYAGMVRSFNRAVAEAQSNENRPTRTQRREVH
ncbi:MAG TPA: hypothetical protein VMR92_08540 [Gemmatimonadales bacterium]|nr:hypothetical protein [Gemmatimonadales bacterium]